MKEIIIEVLKWVPAIVAAFFAYNQHTKNKMLDFKLERLRREEALKSSKRSEDMACIYSELYKLLHNLQVDRVYILQPHPLINNLYITITMEVRRKGVSSMMGQVKRLPMGEVAHFVGQLAKEPWIICNNIEEDVIDKKAKAIMSINGTNQVIVRKLTDINNTWIGNIFVENREIDSALNTLNVRAEIEEVANNIQFILPEFKDLL